MDGDPGRILIRAPAGLAEMASDFHPGWCHRVELYRSRFSERELRLVVPVGSSVTGKDQNPLGEQCQHLFWDTRRGLARGGYLPI